MIIIDNKQEQTKVKVLSVFSLNEIAVEYDTSILPQREDIKGKRAELFYDKETEKLYYEYIDIPKTEIELLQEETQKLKLAIAESAEVQQQDKIENQLAVAELVETLTNKEIL
ncbi:hypothetical protein B1B04_24305 [Lysinibacillus sp. KCTC 33748]|uniref:hypothetical protein n=1 Tax=unclassified Lysinibacillus TaxID=2636778 RepID=UPI0009A56055|nr:MULTISPECIES: hypothetical protein [unclassified Lysinibacillus]OXS66073.1 hypothetical protein B1B04_24305 [Lysinibacillus sp. KCTC 33748]SKC18343.1 hypothetical protein SAMN06295926_1372 [Lysinibacillus sp. AC-3]